MLAFYLTVPHEFKAVSLIYFVTRLGYFVQGSLIEGKNTRCVWKVNKLCWEWVAVKATWGSNTSISSGYCICPVQEFDITFASQVQEETFGSHWQNVGEGRNMGTQQNFLIYPQAHWKVSSSLSGSVRAGDESRVMLQHFPKFSFPREPEISAQSLYRVLTGELRQLWQHCSGLAWPLLKNTYFSNTNKSLSRGFAMFSPFLCMCVPEH